MKSLFMGVCVWVSCFRDFCRSVFVLFLFFFFGREIVRESGSELEVVPMVVIMSRSITVVKGGGGERGPTGVHN